MSSNKVKLQVYITPQYEVSSFFEESNARGDRVYLGLRLKSAPGAPKHGKLGNFERAPRRLN